MELRETPLERNQGLSAEGGEGTILIRDRVHIGGCYLSFSRKAYLKGRNVIVFGVDAIPRALAPHEACALRLTLLPTEAIVHNLKPGRYGEDGVWPSS